MVAKSTAPVETHQLKEWRDRLENLERLLETAPPSEWEWLWKIRHRIMKFLLARYEQERLIDAGISTEVGSQPVDEEVHLEDTKPYSTRREWTAPDLAEDMGKPLRSKEELRAFLERTSKVNEDRHIDWEKMRMRMMKEMREAIRSEDEIRRLTPAGDRLSEKTIHIFARAVVGAAGFLLIMLAIAYRLTGVDFSFGLVVVLVVGAMLVLLSATSWPVLLFVAYGHDDLRRRRKVVAAILLVVIMLQSALIAVLLLNQPGQSPLQVGATSQPDADAKLSHFERGVKAINDYRHDQAIEFFTSTIEKDPKHLDAYMKRAECHMNMAQRYPGMRRPTEMSEHVQSAMDDFRSATLPRDDPDLHCKTAARLIMSFEYLEKHVKMPTLGQNKWRELWESIHDEARWHYESAIKKDVFHEDARMGLAQMMYELERYDECRRTCSMLLEINHRHYKGRMLRAWAAAAMGDREAATADCNWILDAQPDYGDAADLMDELLGRGRGLLNPKGGVTP